MSRQVEQILKFSQEQQEKRQKFTIRLLILNAVLLSISIFLSLLRWAI